MTIIDHVMKAISQIDGNVVLRSEVTHLGSPARISATLTSLQKQGILVRIGQGIYAKAKRSDKAGEVVPAASLEALTKELFMKLGIPVRLGGETNDNELGEKTTKQGPLVLHTGERRVSRKLTVAGREVIYENQYCPSKDNRGMGHGS